MFALSTAWNAERWLDAAPLVAEIAELGFRQMELNFSLPEALVRDIGRQAQSRNIAITSLHNYCPFPETFKKEIALPDCYSLAAADEGERRQAVFYTKRTIETARQLGARAVVLHCGRVEVPDQTRALIRLYRTGGPEAAEVFLDFMTERMKKAGPHLDQLFKSLDALLLSAEENRIVLGIENRFYYREIPNLDECGQILERYEKHPLLGYWHDVGHAFIFEKLGFVKPNAWLETCGERLCGLHLHNIKDMQDHQSPCEGDFDILSLEPHLKKDVIRVFEPHAHASAQSITACRKKMEEVLS